jgi:predicted ATPase
MTINRLTQCEVGAMFDRIVGNKLLPASIRQDIIERTDGIPLFVEEMTKAMLEAENESAAQQTVAAAPSLSRPIPSSLHASLIARLDRLDPRRNWLFAIGSATWAALRDTTGATARALLTSHGRTDCCWVQFPGVRGARFA